MVSRVGAKPATCARIAVELALAAALGLFATGCVRDGDVPLPELPTAGGAVVLAFSRVEQPDARLLVVHDGTKPVRQTFTADPNLVVEAIVYGCTRETLGLPEGTLERDTLLPSSPSAHLYRLALTDGAPPRWDPLPLSSAAALFAPRSECARFSLITHALPGTETGSGHMAVVLDDERVLVSADVLEANADTGGRQDPFWIVTREGAELVPDAVLPHGTAGRAGWRDPSGAIYALGGDGRFQHIELGGPIVDLPPLPSACPNWRAWLTGPTDPTAPFELYAVTNSAGLYRFADGAWSPLTPRAPDCAAVSADGWIEWRAPGEAAAILPAAVDGFLHVRDGTNAVFERMPLRPLPVFLRTFADVTGWGRFLGGEVGLYEESAEGWTLVTDHALTKVTYLHPLDGSMLCSCNERLYELNPREDCTAEGFGLGRHIQAIRPIGRDLFIFAQAAGARVTASFVSRTRDGPDACLP